jgi:hypothetical protein
LQPSFFVPCPISKYHKSNTEKRNKEVALCAEICAIR